MGSYTQKFDFARAKDIENRRVLVEIYRALEEKGYNPINQIVGYLLTEDPTYITTHNKAQILIRKLDREDLLQSMVASYLLQKKP